MEAKPLSHAHHQLIAELKRLRESMGLSGQRLGELLGWSQSKVSKIENGRTRPSVADVTAWARAANADADTTTALLSLADTVSTDTRGWSARHGSLAARNLEIGQAEAEIAHLQNFQPAVMPGLLQTAEYARRVITMLDVSGQRDVAAAVNARMQRQAILYNQEKQFSFILTEGALRWRPGPPDLMLAQRDRLLSVSTLPNVTVGVLPDDQEAVALYANGFTILDVPDAPFVLVETLTQELQLHEEGDLQVYREAFARLREAALTGPAAAEFIQHVMPRKPA
jgi:transcriptional regulator with XRE-family HTH domain